MKKLIVLLSLLPLLSFASGCPSLYPDSKPIEVTNTVELCNSFYVSIFDKENNRVILVSEHLLKGSDIGSAERDNKFHSDSRIGHNPSPSDYANTGFDKGHMAPAGDSSNPKEMFESFLMTNMTPQKPSLNRISWKNLEESTRKLFSQSHSDMYVVNIAVYGNNKKMNGIPVPMGYWKIVTVDGQTKYYYAANLDYAKVIEQEPVNIQSLLPH